ncbi:hypothetical protein EV651_104391 [Kribbella sp. VKM Ac-2571]|uniref:hypothetical protein n=1 Tax=Kribbella sp. VKM Ac-2571 TaxID=2512222 RepID=UPI0010619F20|nr:hypothetical protein [Kribbella sp. VKM Ac-2571]TDO66824.1 hypothetical protein EV651_104391 [Kribbella sp. VKM Ac-2571]
MTADEKITLWLAQLRVAGRAVVVARLVIAVAGAVALVVPSVQSWDQADLVPIVGGALLLCTVVLPDSLAALLFVLVVTLGWLMRAPGAPSWSLALTAVALVVVHLAAAFAGQLPSYARVHRAALRRWWLPGAIAVLLAPAVAGAAALVRNADVAGSLVVTAAATALTAATIWFAADQKLSRD